MYIAALFTIAKIWKETKVDKTSMVHLYNGILLSHKKEKMLPFVTTWIDLENIMLSAKNQS